MSADTKWSYRRWRDAAGLVHVTIVVTGPPLDEKDGRDRFYRDTLCATYANERNEPPWWEVKVGDSVAEVDIPDEDALVTCFGCMQEQR